MQSQKAKSNSKGECYTLGYDEWTRQWMERRSADSHANFLLPLLKKGMRLLDCGCGPGAITLDLASIVNPGEVIGIDVEPSQIYSALENAKKNSSQNATFSIADVYSLPFPDSSFDVVFAHALLMHLKSPEAALCEIFRVLKPGGIAGISDPDFGGCLWAPLTPILERLQTVFLEVLKKNGANPFYARQLRQLVADAGFDESHCSAYFVSYGSSDSSDTAVEILTHYMTSPPFKATVIGEKLADNRTFDEMLEDLKRWGNSSGAFYALPFCACVAWKRANNRRSE